MFGEKDNKIDWNGVWVDFIEGEVEPDLERDMQELLRLSQEQRKSVETMLWTKEMVKCVDPSHEDYLQSWNRKDNLSKIMDACDKLQRDRWVEENWSRKIKWLSTERK